MEMTSVKSLHSGDPDVICPGWLRICGLASADILAAGRWFADALQVLFGLHPSVVHVCWWVYSCNTCTGGAMSRAFSTGHALICRCSKQLSASCSNGSFLECLPLTEEALLWLPAEIRKFAEIFAAQGLEKTFNLKNFNNFIWSPLGRRGNIYINYCLQVTFRCLQPDIVPIICHRCHWYRRQFATGVIDPGCKFATGVVDTGGAPWLANISANFRKNSKWS